MTHTKAAMLLPGFLSPTHLLTLLSVSSWKMLIMTLKEIRPKTDLLSGTTTRTISSPLKAMCLCTAGFASLSFFMVVYFFNLLFYIGI